jgi:predicted ATPase
VLLLAPVTDPAALPHALAAALRLDVVQGDVLAACVAVLGDGPALLVVDNCEHLLDAVRDVVGVVLAGCPRLSVLATSREPLGLGAEYVCRLAPLPLPGPDTTDRDLPEVASVAVFLDRVRRVRPGPPPTPAELRLVADVVRRLDGIPLAIELAAGRLSTFTVSDLHARLDRALDLLGGGRPTGDARHRTLRTTVEWSYRLLTDDEQRLFRHLAVFVDGVALDTAELLAANLGLGSDPGALLSRLVDASMVEPEFAAGTRYRMLETLRAFGLDRLAAAGEDQVAERRLLTWAVVLAAEIATDLAGPDEPAADALLRRERANLRAAWQIARRHGAFDEAAALVTALFAGIGHRDLVEIRGWAEELADELLRNPALATHPAAAAVLGTAAEAVYQRGDYARAEQLARTGLARATDTAGTLPCLYALAVAELARGAHADVVEHAFAAAALTPRPGECLGIAALATAYSGDLDRARELNGRALAAADSPSYRSWAAYVQGEIENAAGRLDLAERHYRNAVDLARRAGATFLAGVAKVGLVTALGRSGQVPNALRGYRDVVDYFARTGNWTHLWTTLRNLADLLRRIGDPEPAALLDAAADRAPDASAVPGDANRAVASDRLVPGRAEVLAVAREAVNRNLTRR